MVRLWLIVLLALGLASFGFSQTIRSTNANLTKPSIQQFFISQKKNLYGIGDTSAWYHNSPIGDTLFHLGDFHFAVRTSNRYYSIYNESFKPLHQRVKTVREFGNYVLLEDSVGWKIFSMNDDKATEYFDSVHIYDQYAWLFKKGKEGFFRKDGLFDEIVLPLYDKVGPYYNGVLLIDHGKLGWKGAVTIPVEFDHIYKERLDIIAAENNEGTVYYSLEEKHQLLIEPRDSVVFYKSFYKRVRGKQQSIFYLKSNAALGEINNYNLHPFSFDNFSGSHSYCIVEKDSNCALFRNGKILTGFDYDNFLPESEIFPPFFRVVKNHKVGVINETGEFQLKTNYTDIIDRRKDYYIVRVGDRLGLCLKGDSVILPANYQRIDFYSDKYVYVSFDGHLFGLYNYITKQEVAPCKYQFFNIDSIFVLAGRDQRHDVYFKEQLKFSELYDAQSNGATVKGYKEGKIYIGSVRKNNWEDYNYEIPSYKVVVERFAEHELRPFNYVDKDDVYDYSVGKWGHYSFHYQKWAHIPLAHGGDSPNGAWLLGFHRDTSIAWNGINFYSGKSISPLQIAWHPKSKYHWMDVNLYSYPSNDYKNTQIIISPICYAIPGKGSTINDYKPATVNAVFKGKGNHSIITDEGKLEIAKQGDMILSEYISQLSTNGSIHPQSISDYEKILDPQSYIRIKGGSEHVLQKNTNQKKHVSVFSSFEWLDKNESNYLIFRSGSKYGLMSDSADYILKPEYEMIKPVKLWGATILKVGVKAEGHKLFDPKTNSFSKFINRVIDHKGELILVRLDNEQQAVLTATLDTLIKTTGIITLIADKDYAVLESGIKTVYRDQTILFTFKGDAIEKINNEHFLVRSFDANVILSYRGDTLFKSRKSIKYLSLGNHYLLDDGSNHTLFGKDDAVIYQFQKLSYLPTENQDLIIKDENMVTVFGKNKTTKIQLAGKFVKATKHYIVLNLGKYKRVYSIQGEMIQPKAKQVKVLNDDYISYQEGKNFYLLNVTTKGKKKIKNLNINLSKEGIDYEDTDETLQSLTFEGEDSLSIVEYKGMYGLKLNGKIVLPYKYFQIEKVSDVYLVQDNIEYKLYNMNSPKFISNTSYEKIHPYKGSLMVVKKGVISYINPYGKLVSGK